MLSPFSPFEDPLTPTAWGDNEALAVPLQQLQDIEEQAASLGKEVSVAARHREAYEPSRRCAHAVAVAAALPQGD